MANGARTFVSFVGILHCKICYSFRALKNSCIQLQWYKIIHFSMVNCSDCKSIFCPLTNLNSQKDKQNLISTSLTSLHSCIPPSLPPTTITNTSNKTTTTKTPLPLTSINHLRQACTNDLPYHHHHQQQHQHSICSNPFIVCGLSWVVLQTSERERDQ